MFYKARDNSYIIDPNIILRSLLTFEACIFLPDIVSVINEKKPPHIYMQYEWEKSYAKFLGR